MIIEPIKITSGGCHYTARPVKVLYELVKDTGDDDDTPINLIVEYNTTERTIRFQKRTQEPSASMGLDFIKLLHKLSRKLKLT